MASAHLFSTDMILIKAIKHFKKILEHKWNVLYFCHLCGITWQGIVHDMSKFSPTEFFESVKYYSGTKSPIPVCKELNGYSLAWQHHKGRNPHHNVYWTDNFDKGTTAIKMPKKYAIELICDYLGAGKAYNKGISMNDLFKVEYRLWMDRKDTEFMHPQTRAFVTEVIQMLYDNPDDYKSILKNIGDAWDKVDKDFDNVKINY